MITSDTVDIDKTTAKTVLMAFLNNWKFASKEDAALLEGYFSFLVSVKFFVSVEKPFLKLVSANSGSRSVKWSIVALFSHLVGRTDCSAWFASSTLTGTAVWLMLFLKPRYAPNFSR